MGDTHTCFFQTSPLWDGCCKEHYLGSADLWKQKYCKSTSSSLLRFDNGIALGIENMPSYCSFFFAIFTFPRIIVAVQDQSRGSSYGIIHIMRFWLQKKKKRERLQPCSIPMKSGTMVERRSCPIPFERPLGL